LQHILSQRFVYALWGCVLKIVTDTNELIWYDRQGEHVTDMKQNALHNSDSHLQNQMCMYFTFKIWFITSTKGLTYLYTTVGLHVYDNMVTEIMYHLFGNTRNYCKGSWVEYQRENL
jgi:hypothetical protein